MAAWRPRCQLDTVFPGRLSKRLHREAHHGTRFTTELHPDLVDRHAQRTVLVRVALVLDLLQCAARAGHFLHLELEQVDRKSVV